MKVIKKINNNFAVCLDNNGNELIAYGKGIGFCKIPYELLDLDKIDRTYYGINSSYYRLLEEIPEQIFDISATIVDYARCKIKNELNSNIVFTLADHIKFAIDRYHKKMHLKIPFTYDVQHLYEEEIIVGRWAINLIEKKLFIRLPKDEATSIALHFINAENMQVIGKSTVNEKKIIDDLTKIIEDYFAITINQDGFNYSRFVSHLEYLIKRKGNLNGVSKSTKTMFKSLKSDLIETYNCVMKIKEYLSQTQVWHLGEEELLYLMIHVNRLYTYEDCNH